MSYYLLIPFVIQAIAITFDEFYFHVKRGLPLWERIGHPIDTLSALACFLYVLWSPYSATALVGYICLAVLSCLLVTKDEWVHKEHCEGKEQWLHALLFLNHSIMLLALAFIWKNGHFTNFLWVQTGMVGLFCLYQIIYWNYFYVRKRSYK